MIGRTDVTAALAIALFVLALIGFGTAVDGYSQALHPPALLGGQGQPGALAFNLLGYVVPGLLAAVVMFALRGRLELARWPARIGSWMWLLSALAFAAQGMLPLDPVDVEATVGRLHATAWTLWWLSFAAGGVMLAAGLSSGRGLGGLRIAAGATAVLLPLFVLYAPLEMPTGISQRVGLALWFTALLAAGLAARRAIQR
ncbi:MAG: DUF998 domain-containing protein [Pseudomonadota bacterium]|nr:DUF998 domain-containing protein [Pseudomonadota bacterium]